MQHDETATCATALLSSSPLDLQQLSELLKALSSRTLKLQEEMQVNRTSSDLLCSEVSTLQDQLNVERKAAKQSTLQFESSLKALQQEIQDLEQKLEQQALRAKVYQEESEEISQDLHAYESSAQKAYVRLKERLDALFQSHQTEIDHLEACLSNQIVVNKQQESTILDLQLKVMALVECGRNLSLQSQSDQIYIQNLEDENQSLREMLRSFLSEQERQQKNQTETDLAS